MEKQIEEMAKALNEATFGVNKHTLADHLQAETINRVAEYLYNTGYRKRSEGEWMCIRKGTFPPYEPDVYCCSNCEKNAIFDAFMRTSRITKYCPNCGAKMKGE